MSICGNEDLTLPKQILAVEKTYADECRSSTTMQGFALVPIANGAGHQVVIDEGCRERWVVAFDAGPALGLANSRARWAASTKKVIDVEVIGRPINRWVKASDTQLGTAHLHRLPRNVSPPDERATPKAFK